MEFVDLGVGRHLRDYTEIWDLQREVHTAVAAGERPDTALLVEHPSVYTAGRRTNRADRPQDGTPVVDVDRGGKITWHGPGQLVVYPIVRLAEPIDVVAYVRALEDALIGLCADHGLETIRVEGRTGVWLPGTPQRKIAAIGVRVARGVTMHGVAINANPDLTAFGAIVPCGIPDADVTSLSAETGRDVQPADVVDGASTHLVRALTPLLAATHRAAEAQVATIV